MPATPRWLGRRFDLNVSLTLPISPKKLPSADQLGWQLQSMARSRARTHRGAR
jgi:hypothetical protein